MNIKVILLLFIFFAPAASAKVYQHNDYTLDVNVKSCANAARLSGKLTHPNKSVKDDVYVAQDAINKIMVDLKKDCRRVRKMTIFYQDGLRNGKQLLNSNDSWTLREVEDLERVYAEKRSKKGFAFSKQFSSETPSKNHDLASYGYYNSKKVFQSPDATLYLAYMYKPKPSDPVSDYYYVMLHHPEDGKPILNTMPPDPNDESIKLRPEYYQKLTKMLAKSPQAPKFIRHYYKGYHHPKDDRLKVLGPRYVETEILTTRFGTTWRKGKLKIVEHPSYNKIGYDTDRQRPPLTLQAIVSKLGPSAPVTADIDDAPMVALAQEGPSDQYLQKQRALRKKLLAKGLIYKNDAFWAQFASNDIRDIFEGRQYFDSYGFLGTAALMRYLTRKEEQCAHTIKNPKQFNLVQITTTTDGNGYKSSRSDDLWNITVPGRFIPYLNRIYKTGNDDPNFAQTYNHVVSSLSNASIGSSLKDFKFMKETTRNIYADVDKMVNLGNCKAPIQHQLEEMLFNYASHSDPMKNRRAIFKNAHIYSDKVYVRNSANDINTSCLANADFSTSQSMRNYCACTQKVVKAIAPERVKIYGKRYAKLSMDMQAAKLAYERGLKHPDSKLYNRIESRCVGR